MDRINAAQTSWQAGDYSPELEAQLAELFKRRREPRRDGRNVAEQSMAAHVQQANGATRLRYDALLVILARQAVSMLINVTRVT